MISYNTSPHCGDEYRIDERKKLLFSYATVLGVALTSFEQKVLEKIVTKLFDKYSRLDAIQFTVNLFDFSYENTILALYEKNYLYEYFESTYKDEEIENKIEDFLDGHDYLRENFKAYLKNNEYNSYFDFIDFIFNETKDACYDFISFILDISR